MKLSKTLTVGLLLLASHPVSVADNGKNDLVLMNLSDDMIITNIKGDTCLQHDWCGDMSIWLNPDVAKIWSLGIGKPFAALTIQHWPQIGRVFKKKVKLNRDAQVLCIFRNRHPRIQCSP